jgi:hypothetical protein
VGVVSIQRKRRRNPYWGKKRTAAEWAAVEAVPTAFEKECQRLGIANMDTGAMTRSNLLRQWVNSHAGSAYVPEWLLKEWGIRSSWEYE